MKMFRIAAGVAALLLASNSCLMCQMVGGKHSPESKIEEADASIPKDNVAVLEFSGKNVSDKDASIFSDMVRSNLVKMNRVNIVDKTNMDKLLAESKFQQTGATTTDDAVKIGKILNVQKVVMGSFSRMENIYYVNANYVDIETAKIEKSEMLQCNEPGELMSVADKLTTNLLSPSKTSKMKSNAKSKPAKSSLGGMLGGEQ